MEQKSEKNMVKITKPECYPRINSYCRHYIPNTNKPWMFDDNGIYDYWVGINNFDYYSKY